MNLSKHILYSMYTLTLITFLFEATSIDVWIQNMFFDSLNQTWWIDKYEEPYRVIFYLLPKYSVILLALAIITLYVYSHRQNYSKYFQKSILVVILSLILVPSFIGLLKATTNGACPAQTELYGGDVPYVKAFELLPESFESMRKYKCFPAGHASGGFALLSLVFLFHKPKSRLLIVSFAVSIGWIMGGYKMAIGDHFLSHTLTTMILSWILICSIAAVTFRTLYVPFVEIKKR